MTFPDASFILFDNTAGQYLTAVAVFAASLVAFSILEKIIFRKLALIAAHSKTKIDDAVVAMLQSVHPSFYWFIATYLALKSLVLAPIADTVLNAVFLGWVLYQAVRTAGVALDLALTASSADENEERARGMLVNVAKVSLWVIALLLLLSNLGFNITSLVAGLGIGGIAIAFALQNILADLFSSFAIYLDKPFTVGDFIIVGDKMGTVSQIGIKTTRLTALQGEEIVLSNRELTSAHIQNFKKMQERRVAMNFGITYETPRKTVAALPEKIRNAVERAVPDVRIDRIHFAGFGDSSLDFEFVYYVGNGDYNAYMDRQQTINLAILELFEKEKVAFAYPTRTVYTAKA